MRELVVWIGAVIEVGDKDADDVYLRKMLSSVNEECCQIGMSTSMGVKI